MFTYFFYFPFLRSVFFPYPLVELVNHANVCSGLIASTKGGYDSWRLSVCL